MTRRAPRDLAEYLTYMRTRGFIPGTVIDVGTCYGTPDLTATFPEAHHIFIEPLAELEPRLQALVAEHGGEYHLLALADTHGARPLHVPPGAPQGASLATVSSQPRMIPVETLDRLCAGRTLEPPILLKTDCQGLDLQVMQGAVHVLAHVGLVVMEANLFHPAGNPALADFGTIICWMRAHGFAVHDILSYQTRPFDAALGYVDLAFTREDGPFRAHHRWS